MKIAQIAPLIESVPPKRYGGTERVVSYLTEELVAMGHEVTLFASGDSMTNAHLVPGSALASRLDSTCTDPVARHLTMIDQVFRRAREFDVLHFHTDYLHLGLATRQGVPYVTTLHGRLDLKDIIDAYRPFRTAPFVSISYAQREPMPGLNWQGTVYHGIPFSFASLHSQRAEYLAFLGRISREKRVDRAIAIAKQLEMPLRIAAKVDRADEVYFREEIAPLLDHPLIDFIGEIDQNEKVSFLGGARALLFPIDWPEPFGLVMIEAMACGTPVIAFRGGSVTEVIESGVTGFVVDSIGEAVKAVRSLERFDRSECRRAAERRFSVRRMADDYVSVYDRVIRSFTKS